MSPSSSRSPAKQKQAVRPPSGFLDWFLSIFASDDPERQKLRQLREIAGDLKRARPRFYNPAQGIAEPTLARFFYELYRTFAAAQVLLKGAQKSDALKTLILELSLTPEQVGLKERLAVPFISEEAKSMDAASLASEVRRDIQRLSESIDDRACTEIDLTYNRLLVLFDLVGYDYFYFLKKFDNALPERDFAYKPRFEPVDARNVIVELEDFLEILAEIDTEIDWDRVFSILKEYRGVEVVSRDAAQRAFRLLKDAQRSGILLMIVRHMERNPGWKAMSRSRKERFAAMHIMRIKADADAVAQKLAHEKRSQRIDELIRAVFGTATIHKLINYSDQVGANFTRNALGGFTYTAALSYLKSFLTDHFDRGGREAVDILLIKGQWAVPQRSQQLSEAFHQLLKISEGISRFDEELSESGDLGRNIRLMAMKAERDRKVIINLRTALQQINDQAHSMVVGAIQHFVSLGKVLKLAHEDCGRVDPQLIVNWRELSPSADRDVRSIIAATYKKVYNIVQLMQVYK